MAQLLASKKKNKVVKTSTGFVAFEGKSLFDNKPIVGIVTYDTSNVKTGNMAQLWIMRSDIAPHDAVKTGDDQSVCGGCKHRHYSGGACYVTVFQAPLAVYKAYKAGKYSGFNDGIETLKGLNKGLRLGAYGDPAMLPEHILDSLVSASRFHTGYTHQWKNKRLTHALKYCQGSVDSLGEYQLFKSKFPNVSTFRVASEQTDMTGNEIQCLSDSDGLTCAQCRKCDGSDTKDIAILVHGAKASKFSDSQIDIKVVA